MTDLSALRAEVEQKMADVRVANVRLHADILGGYHDLDGDEEELLAIGAGQVFAYARVLDLIDKHTRETS